MADSERSEGARGGHRAPGSHLSSTGGNTVSPGFGASLSTVADDRWPCATEWASCSTPHVVRTVAPSRWLKVPGPTPASTAGISSSGRHRPADGCSVGVGRPARTDRPREIVRPAQAGCRNGPVRGWPRPIQPDPGSVNHSSAGPRSAAGPSAARLHRRDASIVPIPDAGS
jgi:hypothetical protein